MSAATAMPEVVTDLSDPVMFSDPFPRYAELRRTAPVSTVRSKQLLRGDGYMLTRYDDVMQVHTDPRLSSDVLKYGRGGRAIRYAPRMNPGSSDRTAAWSIPTSTAVATTAIAATLAIEARRVPAPACRPAERNSPASTAAQMRKSTNATTMRTSAASTFEW